MNIPFKQQQKAPDVILTGEAIENILQHLNNTILYAKSQDGTLRPFCDPTPVIQILMFALQKAESQQQKGDPNAV
jgi:hypothetical protein